jgi:protein-disulfide isomerase
MRAVALILLAATGVALGLPDASMAAQAKKRAVQRDWSRTVLATPEGGFRMGNPAAKIRLVEYGSLTCHHCQDFAESGYKPLVAKYVRTGKVSYEFRNMILNGFDAGATLVARCGGARAFFRVADEVYATQPQWLGAVSALTATQKAELQALAESDRLFRMAQMTGVVKIAAKHGILPAQSKRCVADAKALEALGKMAERAHELGVQATPTFFINGAKVQANTWPALEPLLAGKGG